MRYIKQIMWILTFSFVGQVLEALIPLPVPAAVYGLVLLLIALFTELLKVEAVKETADLLISFMPVIFIAPAVKVLEYWGLIAPNVGAILVILVFSTVVIFAVSGLTAKWLMSRRGGDSNG